MADKRIFQLEEEGFLDDITDKVYMWLDKKANEGELQEPSWKFKANVFLKILNNFATKFVPNVATVEGKCYWHGGELYMCNVAYTGDWVPGNFTLTSVDELLSALQEELETTNGNVTALTTYAQNVSASIAPPFDPTRDSEHAYKVGESVSYTDGKTYTFKYNHYGPWSATDVIRSNLSESSLSVLPYAVHGAQSTNVDDLNNIKYNAAVVLSNVTSNTATLHLPTDFGTGGGILFVFEAKTTATDAIVRQVLVKCTGDSGSTWIRNYFISNNTWGSWTKTRAMIGASNQIFSNWSSNVSDLNDYNDNMTVIVQRNDGTVTANLPDGYTGSAVLFVQKSYYSNTQYQVLQRLVKISSSETWYRLFSSSTGNWGTWNKISSIGVSQNQIFDDWNKNPADLNAVTSDSVVMVNKTANTTTSNFPSDFDTGVAMLIVTSGNFSGGRQVFQTIYRLADGAVWYRNYNSITDNWTSWGGQTDSENVVEIGTGKRYTTLRAGFEAAFARRNCKVVVYPGVYDLTVECADILETTLTSNFCPCKLGNGMHVVFMEGAKVICNIEKGEMSDAQFNSIKEHFEPMAFYFSGNNGDFTLENAVIESKNCRYCVHDDQGGTTKPYIHKFINCRMYRTNSNITPNVNFVPCIGGGLGKHGTIIIDGGWYRTEPVVGSDKIMNGDLDYQQWPIAYHNGNVEDAQSSITLRDVFFADKGYFQAQDYGPSTLKTKCYISGCRFGLPPMIGVKTDTTNFELTAGWNNDVAVAGEWQVDPEDSSKTIFVESNS